MRRMNTYTNYTNGATSQNERNRNTSVHQQQQQQQQQHYLQSHSRSFNQLVQVELGRHEHPLVKLSLPNLFTCMGCKELGAGMRFSCQSCNFELHDFCATAPPHLKLHPLHPQHQLLLHVPKPSGGGILKSKCDVCGKPSKGYAYRCSASGCSYQLHPTCAMLSTKIEFPSHPHHYLILNPTDTTTGATRNKQCGECKKAKRSGQVYTCTVTDCDYLLHAACAKTMVNGLHAHGFKGLDDHKDRSSTMLGAAARIASHVVIGFIGGFVEGIGESVGEALTQNIVNKGSGSSKRTRSPIGRPIIT